jgi:hypothetical protein
MKNLLSFFGLLIVLSLTACGDGGEKSPVLNHTQPTRISLKVISAGAITSNLAKIIVTVAMPVGFSVDVDNAGKPAATAITPSGVAANITTILASSVSYLAPTTTTPGSIAFEIDSSTSAGFGTGEFASLMLIVAPGKVVIPPQFTASNVTATDVSGNLQGGISISFQ